MNKKQLLNYKVFSGIYAVIDQDNSGKNTLKIFKSCVQAGVEIIQLRDKTLDAQTFYANALEGRKITCGKAIFIINDRADIAKLVDADGLHLGQSDLPICAARKILGKSKIIGKSCHSLRQALDAQKDGADYISIGPIFKTPTKPNAKAVGLKLFLKAKSKIRIPIVAIGGIDKKNIHLLRDGQARIIAVVRAICQAKNIPKAVLELREEGNINDSVRIGLK